MNDLAELLLGVDKQQSSMYNTNIRDDVYVTFIHSFDTDKGKVSIRLAI